MIKNIFHFYTVRRQWFENSLLFFLLILAIAFRIQQMNRGLFFDELNLVTNALESSNFFGPYFLTISNHVGYTLLSFLPFHLLGGKEWAVRLPAFLFGMGGIVLFFYWVKRSFGKLSAFLGLFFLTFSPVMIIWSASARGYSAFVFFTILSTWLYFDLLKQFLLRRVVMLVVVNIIGLSFHVFYGFIILVQLLHVVFSIFIGKSKEISNLSLWKLAAGIGSTLLLSFLIYIPFVGKNLGENIAIHKDLVPNFPVTALLDFVSLSFLPLGLISLIMMFFGLLRSNSKLNHWPLYVISLFFTLVIVWLIKPFFLYSRFFAFLLPFVFLGIANGLSVILKMNQPLYIRSFVIIIVIFLNSFILWSWQKSSSAMVEEFNHTYKQSVEFTESISSDTTRFCAFGPQDGFFQYYAHRPITRFNTLEEFASFYNQPGEAMCFALMGPPMNDEHKKIFLFMLTHAQFKSFDKINVFYIGGKS